jgi:hypothetical protein
MTTDHYRHKLAEFLTTQPTTGDLTHDQIIHAHTRQDLGITSLNMIIVLMNYINKHTNGTITLRPEWIPQLNDIDGITSVLREIDANAAEPTRP